MGFQNKSGKFRDNGVVIQGQSLAVVDDLSIRTSRGSTIEHCQLKNSNSVSWGGKGNSIKEDFKLQSKLCSGSGWTPTLTLVVSNQPLKKKLNTSKPRIAGAGVKVDYFPGFNNIEALVRNFPAFRKALIGLSPFSEANAESEKLVSLGCFMVGHWVEAQNVLSVKDLTRRLDREAGSFFRPLRGSKKLPRDVAAMLSRINGLKYKISKGFLFWSYEKSDSGRFPHHCWSPGFGLLLKAIRSIRPKTFDELEDLLG